MAQSREPVEILNVCYQALCQLAEQIQDHAEKAPYSYVAERLRTIATQERSLAELLKEEILRLGGWPRPSQFVPKPGKNHWERVTIDIEDQRNVEGRFIEYAALLMDEAPEVSDLLQRIVAQQAAHKQSLLDLVARADPQAFLT